MGLPSYTGDLLGIPFAVNGTPQDGTGTLDPTTGAATLRVRGNFTIVVGPTPAVPPVTVTCTIPLDVTLSTAGDGVPYDVTDGTLTLVDKTFSLKGGTCDDPGFTGLINTDDFTKNEMVLSGKLDPIIRAPVVVPPRNNTPSRGNTPPRGLQPTTPPLHGEGPPVTRCVVPKLKGLKLKSAKHALKKSGCRAGKVTRKRSRKKKGTVIGHSPRVGRALASGAKVELTVSSGPPRRRSAAAANRRGGERRRRPRPPPRPRCRAEARRTVDTRLAAVQAPRPFDHAVDHQGRPQHAAAREHRTRVFGAHGQRAVAVGEQKAVERGEEADGALGGRRIGIANVRQLEPPARVAHSQAGPGSQVLRLGGSVGGDIAPRQLGECVVAVEWLARPITEPVVDQPVRRLAVARGRFADEALHRRPADQVHRRLRVVGQTDAAGAHLSGELVPGQRSVLGQSVANGGECLVGVDAHLRDPARGCA